MAPEEVPRGSTLSVEGLHLPCTHNQTEVEVQLHRFLTVLDVVNQSCHRDSTHILQQGWLGKCVRLCCSITIWSGVPGSLSVARRASIGSSTSSSICGPIRICISWVTSSLTPSVVKGATIVHLTENRVSSLCNCVLLRFVWVLPGKNKASGCKLGSSHDADFAGDLAHSQVYTRRSIAHFRKPNFCANFLYVQEADCSVTKQHGSWSYIFGRWSENWRLLALTLGYCEWRCRTPCDWRFGTPVRPAKGDSSTHQNPSDRAHLFLFEDSSSVIKMIIKDRSVMFQERIAMI